jgi:ribonuclease HII
MGERHIGVDEAGRGPAIGPLVVCALSIPKEDRTILKNIGVDDSKRLNKDRRVSIHKEILSKSESRDWEIGVVHCDAARIDRWMENGTLNSLESKLFAEAISLATNISSECTLFLDACDVDAKRFGRSVSRDLGEKGNNCKIISEHRMDENEVITGAASIVAKVNRDSAMDRLSDELGIELGSGYPSDPKTKVAIQELCKEDNLNDCLRRKWRNVERAWMVNHRKPIPPRGEGQSGLFQTALDEWNSQER